jgi:hypothetical protein
MANEVLNMVPLETSHPLKPSLEWRNRGDVVGALSKPSNSYYIFVHKQNGYILVIPF